MSNFVNEWVRCNKCFQQFDKIGGILTSCGHFICNREECQIKNNEENNFCPICKLKCNLISLTNVLPKEILDFFEEPEILINKTFEILKFQNQQKNLIRNHFDQQKLRIKELEEIIEKITLENNKLKNQFNKIELNNNQEILISEFINKQILTSSKNRILQEEEIRIPFEKNSPKKLTIQKISNPSKLFTPTLANKLQNFQNKSLYEKIIKE